VSIRQLLPVTVAIVVKCEWLSGLSGLCSALDPGSSLVCFRLNCGLWTVNRRGSGGVMTLSWVIWHWQLKKIFLTISMFMRNDSSRYCGDRFSTRPGYSRQFYSCQNCVQVTSSEELQQVLVSVSRYRGGGILLQEYTFWGRIHVILDTLILKLSATKTSFRKLYQNISKTSLLCSYAIYLSREGTWNNNTLLSPVKLWTVMDKYLFIYTCVCDCEVCRL
jgi:hypothetical protein